jgi:D-sedoheptulose 7-phosphate isomerase
MNPVFKALSERYPVLADSMNDIELAFDLLCGCYDSGGKLLLCGNGGSAADCAHIVGELMKGFLSPRKLTKDDRAFFEDMDEATRRLPDKLQNGLPAISLCSEQSLLSAYANDVDPVMVYAQQVWVYGQNSPDLLLALSTSGNAENVAAAVRTANALGIDTVAITGADGGKLAELCTVCIRLPETETYKVQELTEPVYHALCAALEAHYFS